MAAHASRCCRVQVFRAGAAENVLGPQLLSRANRAGASVAALPMSIRMLPIAVLPCSNAIDATLLSLQGMPVTNTILPLADGPIIRVPVRACPEMQSARLPT